MKEKSVNTETDSIVNQNESKNENESNLENQTEKNNNVDAPEKIREKLKVGMELEDIKLQEVIKPGQVILIQIVKEEKRSKRCSLNYFYFFSW